MTQQQVVIIGGGLVGGLTALLLAKGGIQACVLDAAPLLDRQQVASQPDPRVLAINLASIKLMQHAGVWDKLLRHQPYSGMQVWNRDGYSQIDFGHESVLAPQQHEWLGSMAEPSILNLAIQEQLLGQLEHYHPQVKIKHLDKLPQHWQITLEDGTQIQTPLLIAADGANSFVRQHAMIDLDLLNYQQTAITCAIRTEQPHQHVARQIFLPTGPLAFLPMHSLHPSDTGYWQSIVWTLPTALAEEYHALDDAQFRLKLLQASHYMRGEIHEVVSRAAFPLIARHAQRYIGDGLALIGDAAHVIHPLAGQGVNLGCLDAGVLVDCLLKDAQRGAWASQQSLNKYQQRRRMHNQLMMHSMSGLGWVSKSQSKLVQLLRNEGMRRIAGMPMAIDFFTQQASGLSALKKTQYAQL